MTNRAVIILSVAALSLGFRSDVTAQTLSTGMLTGTTLRVESVSGPWWSSTVTTTLLGVAVGAGLTFLFGELSELRRHARTTSQVRASVRSLLKVELGNNLAALTSFRKDVAGEGNDAGAATADPHHVQTVDPVSLAQRFASRPLPVWSHLMWTSQAAHLTLALTAEEIGTIHALQADAQRLAEYHKMLQSVIASDYLRPRTETVDFGIRTSEFPVIERFPGVARDLWPDIETLLSAMLNQGNPIKDNRA